MYPPQIHKKNIPKVPSKGHHSVLITQTFNSKTRVYDFEHTIEFLFLKFGIYFHTFPYI